MKIRIIFFLIQTCAAVKDGVPVFVLDFDNIVSLEVPTNPLTKMPTAVFTNILKYAEKKSDHVLIIVENSLSTEDLTSRDKSGTPFANLHRGLKGNKVVYIPSVSNPYNLITEVFHRDENNVIYAFRDYKFKPFTSRCTFLHFVDSVDVSRKEMLRSHDVIIMHAIFNAKLMGGSVVGFYTGKMNPVAFDKLPPVPRPTFRSPDTEKPHVMTLMVASDGGLFKFSVYSPPHALRGGYAGIGEVTSEMRTRRQMATTIQYTHLDLQFNFRFFDTEWLLDNVALMRNGVEVGSRSMGVGAPWNCSYVCAEPINLVNLRDRSIFVITSYQLQPKYRNGPTYSKSSVNLEGLPRDDKPWRRDDDDDDEKSSLDDGSTDDGQSGGETDVFGETVNCVSYFSAEILAGLFVAALSLAIAGFGVAILFNCQTNSNFEDPAGKSIVVQADTQ